MNGVNNGFDFFDDDLEELEEPEGPEDLEEFPLEAVDVDNGVTDDEPFSGFNPFANSVFPVLFINNALRIINANKACENLFTGFFKLEGNPFIDVFGRSFA
ncbi:MAG: hypothetical protein LBH57_01675, partial [Treponema sp.]|nr:hypothetical protein [Treponema sp.]